MSRRKMRSLYLGHSLLDDIERTAEKQRRTMSQQICFLLDIALAAPSLPSGTADAHVDDAKGRVYVYLEPALDRRVSAARKQMGGADISYSACVRALVMGGLAVQRRFLVCSKCRAVETRRVVLTEVSGE